MLRTLFRWAPARYRMMAFLVSTSIVGVTLILIAVYNASNELEVIHEIENMHRFALAQSGEDKNKNSLSQYERLGSLSKDDYRVLLMRDGAVLADSHATTDAGWLFDPVTLEESRVNEAGGYMTVGDQLFIWTMLPADEEHRSVLIQHRFQYADSGALTQVYTKRILVPALFYIWLMIWMGYIVRHLTQKLSEQKKEMERMALHDTLTGLPNRNLLTDRLNTMMDVAKREQSSLTVVMMDLDGFKKINDTWGHAMGDSLLKEVAVRLKSCLRPNDTVCRHGGDEFIVLLDDTLDDSSLDICRRMSFEVSRPIVIDGKELHIGSSMGVVRYSDHDDDPDELIHKADQAMYEVKAKGGGIQLYGAPDVSDREKVLRLQIVAEQ